MAVFLALGIGILIGNFMGDEGVLIEEQKKLMAALERDLLSLMATRDQLKARVTLLESEKGVNEEFINFAFPLLIEGALKEKNMVLINLRGDEGSKIQEGVEGVLRKAGASSIVSCTIVGNLDLSTFPERDLLQKLGIEASGPGEPGVRVVDLVIRAIVSGRGMENITPLVEAGFVTLKGESSTPADSVVIIPPDLAWDVRKDYRLDLIITDTLKKLDVQVIGVETTAGKASFVDDYKGRGISTVDNVDTIPGKVALVYALRGSKGNYGVKGSASSLLPSLGE